MYRNPRLVKALGRLNIVHYTLVGIVITVVVVSGFSVYFHGHVTKDYLITGTFTCVVVSLFVVGVLKIHQRALNLEITRRQAAEQEKDRLIEQLEQSLLMQQELAELKVREKERELLLTVRNEKLKTLASSHGQGAALCE